MQGKRSPPRAAGPDRLALQHPAQELDVFGERNILRDQLFYFLDGVHDRCVIPTTEIPADFLKAVARVPTGQVHADLPREGDALVAFLALEVAHLHVVVLGDDVGDLLDGDPPRTPAEWNA